MLLRRPRRPPVLPAIPPQRVLVRPFSSRPPQVHLPATFATSVVLAGAGVGALTGTITTRTDWRSGGTRSFWRRPLECEEAKAEKEVAEQTSFLDKFPSISLPDLPSPPSFNLPSIPVPSISLPNVQATLSSWSSSLTSLRSTFGKLQEELSLGPGSTYARIVAEGKNPAIHPELQFDASVRLGNDLALSERAYLRVRREAMREAFAKLVGVPLAEVDTRDLPVVAIAASGGGYRAMLNTLSSLTAAKESGLWDVVSFISGVSGSCWALNTIYSIGGGSPSWTLQHLRQRIKEPFLQPETLLSLLDVEDKASSTILTSVILKEASKGGEISLVDAYGTLVSTRLYVPSPANEASDVTPPPRPLSIETLKTSSQRTFIDDGSNPLPIYCTVRHDLPSPSDVEAAQKAGKSDAEIAAEGKYTWFEITPYETGSDSLGAWIPTWSLGRLFDGGKSVEKVPELGLPVLSGIYASAFCATLLSYYREVRPLLATLPLFSTIDNFVNDKAHTLSTIHPFPPAELPNFLYNLHPYNLPSTIPKAMTELKTLGFADAGMELNLPYVPLMRRQADIVLALDASADSQDQWFLRAAEYAKQYASEGGPSRWPSVNVEALFPPALAEKAMSQKGAVAEKVDEAKRQEGVVKDESAKGKGEREGVRTKNPEPTPLGSAPESREKGQEDAGKGTGKNETLGMEGEDKPMPESQVCEPPLGQCSIWLGSTSPSHLSTCRNDCPSLSDVQERDGIALAYIPLRGDDEFKDPLDVFSTWRFDYTEEETDKLVRLAKANFLAGEEQIKTLLKGVWLRKRQKRLAEEGHVRATDSRGL
ncbi:hypothetical protein JCM11251_000967 [Rhodosporidiobolus azoricus]